MRFAKNNRLPFFISIGKVWLLPWEIKDGRRVINMMSLTRWLLSGCVVLGIAAGAAEPFSDGVKVSTGNRLDRLLADGWRQAGLGVPERASDAVFFRRAVIGLTGRLPDADAARAFAADKSPDKREKLIDQLLDSEAFADLQLMYWADVFRVKSEFPINLWPNAVQCFSTYLRDAVRQNRPWNQVALELLTASGSNFRNPPANFFRASADRSPRGLAQAAALAFMNLRLESLPPETQEEFIRFFSRIRFKKTQEWKEEIVYTDPEPAVLSCRMPDGKTIEVNTAERDPRRVFADELLREDSPWFAYAVVNRIWQRLIGRGFVEPADAMFTGNPAVQQPTLELLAREFVSSGYDLKKLYRRICTSAAFQTASGDAAESEKYFSAFPIRRHPAEVVIDLLMDVSGQGDRYESVIPEPFTFLPEMTRAVTVSDGSISSSALENFGRSPRDSGLLAERKNAVTESQRLYLMNSGTLYWRINRMTNQLFRKSRLNEQQRIETLYWQLLSRSPLPQEIEAVIAYRNGMSPRDRWRVWTDLAWALVNSKEFLYQH